MTNETITVEPSEQEEIVNETTNQTVNETAANAAASSDPFTMINNFITALPVNSTVGAILLLIAIAILLALTFVIIYALYQRKKVKGQTYDKNDYSEYIRPDIVKALDKGVEESQRLRHDLHTIGVSFKDVRFNEFDDIDSALSYLKKNDKIDIGSEKIKDLTGTEFDGDELIKEGLIDQEEKQNYVDNGFIPHRLLAVRPEGLFGKFKWLISDVLIGGVKNTTYMLIPEILIMDGGDYIQIPRNIQFREFGGLEVPLYRSSLAILPSMTQRHLLETAYEDLENFSERSIQADPQYRKELLSALKKIEAENNKHSSGIAGDVNNS